MSDKKRLNITLANGLLITQAKRQGDAYVLFITDLQNTERVIFDAEGGKLLGKYGITMTSQDAADIRAAVKKAFD